jgi:hypothetical protein
MHAGEALWQVWGMVGYLNKVGQTVLALHMQQVATVIGEHIGVAPPTSAQLAQLSSALENLQAPADDVGYASERQQTTTSGGRSSSFNDPELVEAANKLVDEMVGSDQFGWADMLPSIEAQLKEKSFISAKQCRALRNIAAGRRYKEDGRTFENFWEWFADENPEAAERVGQEADKA